MHARSLPLASVKCPWMRARRALSLIAPWRRVDSTLFLLPSRMVMGLYITNDETCLLARDLARLTGETMTGAITVALRERLAREKRRRDADSLARELHAIGQRCASLLGPGPSAVEHGDLLYDEHGLPK